MFELSEKQKRIIDGNAEAFAGDLRAEVLLDSGETEHDWLRSGHVFLYVERYPQDAGYFTDLGWSEDAQALLETVQNYEGYKTRSKASAKRTYLKRYVPEYDLPTS